MTLTTQNPFGFIQFELSVLIEQIDHCPPWIGDQDGYLIDYKMEGTILVECPVKWMQENKWNDELTFDEKCEWFSHHISHDDIYEKIAEEYGEDPQGFIDYDSCVDFCVFDFSEST